MTALSELYPNFWELDGENIYMQGQHVKVEIRGVSTDIRNVSFCRGRAFLIF